jgi:hypothetical protein
MPVQEHLDSPNSSSHGSSKEVVMLKKLKTAATARMLGYSSI